LLRSPTRRQKMAFKLTPGGGGNKFQAFYGRLIMQKQGEC